MRKKKTSGVTVSCNRYKASEDGLTVEMDSLQFYQLLSRMLDSSVQSAQKDIETALEALDKALEAKTDEERNELVKKAKTAILSVSMYVLATR